MKTFTIERERRIPVSVTLTCLVSLLAFYLASSDWSRPISLGPLPIVMPSGGSGLIVFFAVSLIVSRIVPYRVNNISPLGLVLRVGVLVVAFLNNNGRDTKLIDAFIFAPALDFVTHCFAAEMALEPWLKWPPGAGKAMVFLSGLVFFAGCATDDTTRIVWLAPLYFFCLILALRSFTSRDARIKPFGRTAMRLVSIAVVLALGSYLQFLFRVHKDDIVQFGMETLGNHAPQQSHSVTGIDKEAQLTDEFNTPGSSNRMIVIHGAIEDPHLHGMTYSLYHTNSWSPDLKSRAFIGPLPDSFLATSSSTKGAATVTRLVDDDGMVSAPLSCAAIQFADTGNAGIDKSGAMLKAGDAPFDYTIVSSNRENYQGPLADKITTPERTDDLEVPPEVTAQMRAIDAKVAPPTLSPALRINAVTNFLLANNKYANDAHFGGGDKVSAFVVYHKPGNCEYFASSATIMLRLAGIPARYVIGYYAHEGDGNGGIVVRAQDAHAWCEAWLDGTGWVTVDATPADGRPDKTAKSEWWWKWRDKVQDMVVAAHRFLASPSGALKTGIAAALLIGLAVYAAYQLFLSRRQKTVGLTYTAADKNLVPLVARFEKLLAQRGAPCPPNRPWAEHIASLTGLPSLDTNAALHFVERYKQARFGDDHAAYAELDGLLRGLEK